MSYPLGHSRDHCWIGLQFSVTLKTQFFGIFICESYQVLPTIIFTLGKPESILVWNEKPEQIRTGRKGETSFLWFCKWEMGNGFGIRNKAVCFPIATDWVTFNKTRSWFSSLESHGLRTFLSIMIWQETLYGVGRTREKAKLTLCKEPTHDKGTILENGALIMWSPLCRIDGKPATHPLETHWTHDRPLTPC